MQKCSICDKAIYNQPTPKKGTIVCGSCPLNRPQGGASGKSYHEVRMDMARLVTNPTSSTEETAMMNLKVRSNVRNNTILLDGRFPVVFGSDGQGVCPAHLRALFEREMMMKPGRFSFVVDAPPVVEAPAPEPFVVEPVVEVVGDLVATVEPEPVVTVDEPVAEDVPVAVDQSFLATDDSVKPVKASKKK